MDNKPKLVVREARLQDLPAMGSMMEINSRGYQGGDFLAEMYPLYIQDPNRDVVVLVEDGKIIGLSMLYSVNGGRAIVGQAARIDPKYRQKKHFLLLRNHRGIINSDNERFSRATKYYGLYADFHYHKEQIKQGKWTWNYKFTMHRVDINFDFPGAHEKLQNIAVNKMYDRGTICLTRTEALLCLNDPDNQWRLFPHRIMILAWDPYKVDPENVSTIVRDSDVIIGTSNCQSKEFGANYLFNTIFPGGKETKNSTDSKENSQECMKITNYPLKAISFGKLLHVRKGLHYDMSFYGGSQLDLLDHVTKHAQKLLDLHRKGSVFLVIYMPQTVDLSLVEDELKAIFDCVCNTKSKMHFAVGPIPKPKL